jgi:hypothetical protein
MFRGLRGIVDSRVGGENVIVAIQKLYESTSKLNEGDDPHVRLIKTAHSRLKTQNMVLRKGYTDAEIMVRSFAFSAVPACLHEGHNSRLLALHLLRMERADVWGNFPEFQAEEAGLLRSLEREVTAGNTLLDIYKRRNPLLQIADMYEYEDGYSTLCAILTDLESKWATNLESPAAQNAAIKQPRQAAAQKKDPSEVSLGDFPKAQMAVEYRREAAETWSQAQGLPGAYVRRFLEALDADPKCDALEVLSSLKEELQRELRPFDDEAANDALEDVRTISHSAAAEFKSVYETLGDTIPLADILQRIEANYRPSARTIALGGQRKQEELERQRKLERERVEQVRRERERLREEGQERERREREPSEQERRQEERNPKILTILVILTLIAMYFLAFSV